MKRRIKRVLETYRRTPAARDDKAQERLDRVAGLAAIGIDNAGLVDGLRRSHAELFRAHQAAARNRP